MTCSRQTLSCGCGLQHPLCSRWVLGIRCLRGLKLTLQRPKKDTGGQGERKKRKNQLLGNGRCPALLLTPQQAATWPLPSAALTPLASSLPPSPCQAGDTSHRRTHYSLVWFQTSCFSVTTVIKAGVYFPSSGSLFPSWV